MSPIEELLSSRIRTESVAPAHTSNDLLNQLPAEMRAEARTLIRDVRAVAEGLREARRRAAMELAPRIASLKEKLCRNGGDRVSAATRTASAVLVPAITWEGFATEAFGVSMDTVDRWLNDYEARGRFVALLNGEDVSYTRKAPITKEVIEVVVSPDKFTPEHLRAELDEIDLGNKPAARAWAGLQTGQNAGSKRAPIDHLQVWKKACVALRAANYQALIGRQKSTAVTALSEALQQLPHDVRAGLVFDLQRSLKEGTR